MKKFKNRSFGVGHRNSQPAIKSKKVLKLCLKEVKRGKERYPRDHKV